MPRCPLLLSAPLSPHQTEWTHPESDGSGPASTERCTVRGPAYVARRGPACVLWEWSVRAHNAQEPTRSRGICTQYHARGVHPLPFSPISQKERRRQREGGDRAVYRVSGPACCRSRPYALTTRKKTFTKTTCGCTSVHPPLPLSLSLSPRARPHTHTQSWRPACNRKVVRTASQRTRSPHLEAQNSPGGGTRSKCTPHLVSGEGRHRRIYAHSLPPSLPPSLTRTEKTKTKNEDKKRTHQDRACAFALALALVRARALRLLALSRCRALSPSLSLALALALSPRIVYRTLQAPVSLARSPLRSRAPVRSLAHPRPVPEPPPPGAREPTSRAM